MAQRIVSVILGACIALHGPAAFAQDEALGPPEVLQYPLVANESAPRAVTGPFLRKAIEDAVDLSLCEALMREAGHEFPDGFSAEDCTQAFRDKVRNRDGIVHWRSENARPLKCGASCLGRPFLTGTRHVDRPNLRETMLYGHLDFIIDPPGPINRDLTYFFDVHVQCKAPNGARTGNIEVRVNVGAPVIGDPGGLESVLDFILLPAQISQRIESLIRATLQQAPDSTIPGDPCRSIGASLAVNPLFDSAPFDPVSGRVLGIRPGLGGIAWGQSERAKVEFLTITRKPLPALVAPEHAQPGNFAAGYFTVYLNGAVVAFPPPLGQPDGLALPPDGGTVPLNYCRTVSLDGADRLQLLFVNGLGGAVWSQFPRTAKFGADTPRRITTGRWIVVPGTGLPNPLTGQPTPAKPQSVVLREFELLYRITYLPAPVVSDAGASGGRGPHGGAVTGVLGDRPVVVSDGSPAAAPCREI